MASVTPGPSTRSWAAAVLGGADLLALTGHSENTAHRVPLGHVAAYLLRQAPGRPRRGLSRYFLPAKNSLMFSPLNLAPSTMVWPMPVNISLNPGPT